jgi:hypothetical protein
LTQRQFERIRRHLPPAGNTNHGFPPLNGNDDSVPNIPPAIEYLNGFFGAPPRNMEMLVFFVPYPNEIAVNYRLWNKNRSNRHRRLKLFE